MCTQAGKQTQTQVEVWQWYYKCSDYTLKTGHADTEALEMQTRPASGSAQGLLEESWVRPDLCRQCLCMVQLDRHSYATVLTCIINVLQYRRWPRIPSVSGVSFHLTAHNLKKILKYKVQRGRCWKSRGVVIVEVLIQMLVWVLYGWNVSKEQTLNTNFIFENALILLE